MRRNLPEPAQKADKRRRAGLVGTRLLDDQVFVRPAVKKPGKAEFTNFFEEGWNIPNWPRLSLRQFCLAKFPRSEFRSKTRIRKTQQ